MLSVALIRGYSLFHEDDITETKCLLRTQVLKTLYRVCVCVTGLDYTPMLFKDEMQPKKEMLLIDGQGIYIFV